MTQLAFTGSLVKPLAKQIRVLQGGGAAGGFQPQPAAGATPAGARQVWLTGSVEALGGDRLTTQGAGVRG